MNVSKVMILLFSFIATQQIFSQYNNGNGTIIESNTNGNIKITVRKHIQRVQVGRILVDFEEHARLYPPNERNLLVYNNPFFESTILFKLSIGDYINISEIYRRDDLKEKTYSVWLRISTDKDQSGYIYYRKFDPYDDNSWVILETIEVNKKIWTARRLEQLMSVWGTNLNVRDKPGLEGSKILFTIIPAGKLLTVQTIAVTEEQENIDNRTDRWVKIKDEQGRIGWIFGGYADVERGGPKYLTPESYIAADYYWYNFLEK